MSDPSRNDNDTDASGAAGSRSASNGSQTIPDQQLLIGDRPDQPEGSGAPKGSSSPQLGEDARERREQLVEERRFLVGSLDEITEQADSGLIDQADYQRIRRNYQARIALVQAQLDGETLPTRERTPNRRFLLWIGLVIVIVGVSWMLSQSLGKRLPGQSVTGNSDLGAQPAAAQSREDLVGLTETSPDDVDAWMDLARFDMTNQNLADAVQEFDTAAQLDPSNPEPAAYGGWVLWLAARGLDGEQYDTLKTGALRRIDDALRREPNYPDALAFRGILLYRGFDDPERAVPSLQRYLAGDPTGPMSSQVRALLQEAIARETSNAPETSKPDPAQTTTSQMTAAASSTPGKPGG